MPHSRFALHDGLCAIFASNSRLMRLFQAVLDTCLDSPFFASLSLHGLHFTVYAPSGQISPLGFPQFAHIQARKSNLPGNHHTRAAFRGCQKNTSRGHTLTCPFF